MIITKISGLSIILLVITLISCEKIEVIINQDKILGTWISIDNSDTLDFTDCKNFYRSTLYMRYDHYDYQLYTDSIKIGYRGKYYILVIPTKHKYNLDGNNLTIDFTNKICYGFGSQVITYRKE